MEINSVCKQAVNVFGHEHQYMKAVEEMGELMTALVQYRDGRVKAEDVITEIADVRIMTEQLAYMFCDDVVDMEYYRKIDRLKDTILSLRLSDSDNDNAVLREARSINYMSVVRRDELLSRCRLPATKNEVYRIYLELRTEMLND